LFSLFTNTEFIEVEAARLPSGLLDTCQ